MIQALTDGLKARANLAFSVVHSAAGAWHFGILYHGPRGMKIFAVVLWELWYFCGDMKATFIKDAETTMVAIIMLQRGLTRAKIAKACGVRPETFSHWNNCPKVFGLKLKMRPGA
ncbi:MAG TPA: hypothetical protein VNV43_08840 [Candidatus Acidoferrales bacterium]|nr:hypothetical protein [Candidatus Acidoferrales bacterium]